MLQGGALMSQDRILQTYCPISKWVRHTKNGFSVLDKTKCTSCETGNLIVYPPNRQETTWGETWSKWCCATNSPFPAMHFFKCATHFTPFLTLKPRREHRQEVTHFRGRGEFLSYWKFAEIKLEPLGFYFHHTKIETRKLFFFCLRFGVCIVKLNSWSSPRISIHFCMTVSGCRRYCSFEMKALNFGDPSQDRNYRIGRGL